MAEDALVERLVQLVEGLVRREMMPQQEWFSIKQAGAYCGLSGAHIRRAVVGGTLSCANVGSADRPTYRINRKDLEDWLQKRKVGPLPPPRKKRAGRAEPSTYVSPHFPRGVKVTGPV